jgi:hypothetical protein
MGRGRTVSRVLLQRAQQPDSGYGATPNDIPRLSAAVSNCSLREHNYCPPVPKKGLSPRSATTSGREEADEPLGQFARLRQRYEVAPREQLDLQAEAFSS